MKFVLLFAFAGSLGAAELNEKISFNNQIQPILSENCYHCHGPDSSTRKPKKQPLRLDREEFAFQVRDVGKPVIVKGDPAASEMLRRIKALDDDIMPPASEHKTLTPAQISLVERWIAQGAKYEKHWSLIPPAKPALPADKTGWAKNPIDAFVAYKLKANGIKPNLEEQKARLFRRLSFDLTGLPPSPKELEAYLKDKDPKAYERAVDRMLATDASAEQFTRLWLDTVRYADTQGIHHDHVRTIWPYRDWVIAAFKANLPFDEFTIEQLAGDLLPEATLDQRIASAYNRLLPTTGEGGAIPEEYAAIYAKDRVENLGATWLGLTTGCATCHDHKFDPIKMKDFYSLTAFFRNNTMPDLDSIKTAMSAPLLFVPAQGDRPRWRGLEAEIADKNQLIQARKRAARPLFESWLDEARTNSLAAGLDFQPALHLPMVESNLVEVTETTNQAAATPPSRVGPFGSAPLVVGGKVVENATPSISRDGQASYGAFLFVEGKPNGAVFSRMNRAENFRGWDLFLTDGRPTVHVIDQWPDTALKITAKEALKPGQWHHVMAVFDGKLMGAEALSLYVNGRKVEVEVDNDNLGPNIATEVPFLLGGRADKNGAGDILSHGKVYLQDLRFYHQSLDASQVARLAGAGLIHEYFTDPSPGRTNALYDLFLAGFDPPSQKLRAELAPLKTEEAQIQQRGATTLTMEEKKNSEPVAWILTRGNYASKGAQVSAAIPDALPPLSPDLPHNRLGLARWLVSRDHPLTARVTVNRLWSHLMGMGIVETTEDFGVMGARPSNQDLLDWLAVEFMDSGWNFRHMIKEMVLSATYRQSEVVTPERLEKDPLNKLFSRGPHIRLDAEEIRDQALVASGLLVQKIGGPPVRPYQPEGVWESVAMKDSTTRFYKQDHGDALYRRSVYTFWKRVAPPPTMEILNAPSREVACTRRDRTDTPLQAFVTMNDPQFVEAARRLAARALKTGKTFDDRLDAITEPLLARRMTKPERAIVAQTQQRALKSYQTDSAAAQSLISVGDSKPDAALAPPELAAWTLVASEVMNLDEALTK